MTFQQTQPLPEVWYRIQNYDFATYLEFSKPTTGEACVTRNLKENPGDKQWWKFVPQASPRNTYKLVNAYSVTQDAYFSPVVDAADGSVMSEDTEEANQFWTVVIPREGSYCTITTRDPQNARRTLLLQTDNIGAVTAHAESNGDEQRWRILEVSPSLPRDTYRIRNIDGTSILTVHDQALVLSTPEGGLHQGWEIIPKGNGKCEIKKMDVEQYLSWQEGEDSIIRVIIAPKPVVWLVKSIGGFAYSVCAVTGKKPDLSLALVDGEELLLKPTKNAHSQVWFFEASKFVLDEEHSGHAKRFPEFPDGDYHFSNVQTGFQIRAENSPAHLYPQTQKDSDSLMRVRYINNTSPYFTIQHLKYFTASFVVPLNDTLVFGEKAGTWYLAKDANNEGYYLCAVGKGKTQVLTGATKKDLQGNDVYVMGDKTANTPIQMWRLVK